MHIIQSWKTQYFSFIEEQSLKPPDDKVYTERHHIIPQFMKPGQRKNEGIVTLTFPNHIEAHRLLFHWMLDEYEDGHSWIGCAAHAYCLLTNTKKELSNEFLNKLSDEEIKKLELARIIAKEKDRKAMIGKKPSNTIPDKKKTLILQDYINNPNLTQRELANKYKVSPASVSNIFKKNNIITNNRIPHEKKILILQNYIDNSKLTQNEIATKHGVSHVSVGRIFKKNNIRTNNKISNRKRKQIIQDHFDNPKLTKQKLANKHKVSLSSVKRILNKATNRL